MYTHKQLKRGAVNLEEIDEGVIRGSGRRKVKKEMM